MERKKRNVLKCAVLGLSASAMMLGAGASFAANGNGNGNGGDSYSFSGECAFLPAGRATEFHGNPGESQLNLGMAGNQWVVFDETIRKFNETVKFSDPTQPRYRSNAKGEAVTLADLQDDSNLYFIELIPPGQIRKQIKSGCMTLGNDEDRNYLPGNYQVDFDVFASTNYNLMQDLANNGFIDEAVPYIRNRLDLMVAADNEETGGLAIGSTRYTADEDFDKQFDIAMDLLSGSIVASSLDHINEGIHNAANGYMKKVDAYINGHTLASTNITMDYHFGDDTSVTGATMTAKQWLEAALAAVATPHATSPGAKRLAGSGDDLAGDAGENHSSHNLADNGCGHDVIPATENDPEVDADYVFCEYAVLNKYNTHESRVHHVETPNGIVNDPAYISVNVGYVWITELQFQIGAGNEAVTGMNGRDKLAAPLGIPNTNNVNKDKIYSLAVLATSRNQDNGNAFINYLREFGGAGQTTYTDGGFTGLSEADLNGGQCYERPVLNTTTNKMESASSDRITQDGGVCPDWLANGTL